MAGTIEKEQHFQVFINMDWNRMKCGCLRLSSSQFFVLLTWNFCSQTTVAAHRDYYPRSCFRRRLVCLSPLTVLFSNGAGEKVTKENVDSIDFVLSSSVCLFISTIENKTKLNKNLTWLDANLWFKFHERIDLVFITSFSLTINISINNGTVAIWSTRSWHCRLLLVLNVRAVYHVVIFFVPFSNGQPIFRFLKTIPLMRFKWRQEFHENPHFQSCTCEQIDWHFRRPSAPAPSPAPPPFISTPSWWSFCV